jgi:acetyltransferase-like isoleucine patch superfamily enzyme
MAMTFGRFAKRFLIPHIAVQLLYYLRHRVIIGPRAEVEYSPLARWGRHCVISSFSQVKMEALFIMGRRVHIAAGCYVGVGAGELHMGDDVLIGPNCTIVAGNYVYSRVDVPLYQQGHTSKGIRIGNNVWIGANSVILDGSQIGDNVIIGAGSMISGAIPKNSIAQGNPARVIFTRR